MFKSIEWAPRSIPMNRRLQTLAAGIWIFLMVFGETACTLLYIGLFVFGNVHMRYLCLMYGMFVYYDRHSANQGGKGSGLSWIRYNWYWQYLQAYFPVNLVKTTDLSPDRNYLFAVYPHGILSCGVFNNFVCDSPTFKSLFPGIRSKVLTLDMHFNIPIWRELLYSWGMASASANSLKCVLNASNDASDSYNSDGRTANAAVIVIGGAQEALNSRPNNYQLVIKKRKGFVRIAIKTGSPLVPVLSFGEVDIFDQKANPVGSRLRRFQEFFKRKTGIAPAFFIGRGLLQYSYGLVPQRRSITTVVGSPIEVTQIDDPTIEQIDMVHQQFMDALNELFETHKSVYIPNNPEIKLIMD